MKRLRNDAKLPTDDRAHSAEPLRHELKSIRLKAEAPYQQIHPTGADNHLGGYSSGPIGDVATYYPNLWTWAIKLLDIKSIIDVGCGEGHSVEFFLKAGCDAVGVEGYEPAARNGRAADRITLHDYTKGPYLPDRQFDMAWSCEFVEHVEEKYIENFLATFSSARSVFMTHAVPGQGGHHHVNERDAGYWIAKLTDCGFELDRELTDCGRLIAVADHRLISPNYPSHFVERGLVFLRR
jgi:SAM-dependent methyltransferase